MLATKIKMFILMVVFLAELACLVAAQSSCVWSDCYTYRQNVKCETNYYATTEKCRGGLGTRCEKERGLCGWAWEVSSGSSFDETQSCH
jgi:hypothetical protein